jgi:Holliday junction resolvasome RuvABC ATP-dependent DNA helicase subunit
MKGMVGQVKILTEIKMIAEEIKTGNNLNVLLIAPSGYGKTTLAVKLLGNIGWDECEMSGPDQMFDFDSNKRVHFMDECHLDPAPEEIYPDMDSGEHTFIFATNFPGKLREALGRRCITLIFEKYTLEEATQIAIDRLKFEVPYEVAQRLAEKAGNNPGMVVNYVTRLNIIFKHMAVPKTVVELDQLMYSVMNIDAAGLNPNERKYIDFLATIGGTASLGLIVNATKLDQEYVERNIEPTLVERGIITISNKGRVLNGYSDAD